MARDPIFRNAPSALGYCFAPARPSRGLAAFSSPEKTDTSTPAIVFLHGTGGSFLWYHHWLREAFPDAIILCPAWGISPAGIPSAYVIEAMRAAESHLGHPLAQPELIGLSAGGFGASSVFTARPDHFHRLTILAAWPPADCLFRRGQQVRLLAGSMEPFAADGRWQRSIAVLRRQGVAVAAKLLPDADHFFLLTRSAESMSWLRSATGSEK